MKLKSLSLGLKLALATAGLSFVAFQSSAAPVGPAGQGAVVALYTPFSFFEKALQKIIGTYTAAEHANLPDQIVKVNELDWHIHGISYDIQSQFSPGTLTPNTYDVASRQLKLAVSIQQISVDQVIKKVFGGVSVQVHVQASCAPITLTQTSAQAAARVLYQISQQSISTHVDQLILQWPAQSWIMSPLSCQGPLGLDDQIKAALITQLQSVDSLKPYLESVLTQKIQTGVETALNQIKQPTPIPVSGSPLQLVLAFKQFQMTNAGLISFADLTWNGLGALKTIRPLEISDVPPELMNSQTPVLITGTSGWTDFIKSALAASPGPTKINMNQQKYFSQILSSSFMEFFFWPDLLLYSKTSPFILNIQTPKLVDLTWQNGQNGGTAQASLTTTAWMQSQRAKKTWNYIQLTGSADAILTPQISAGTFSLTAKISNSKLSEAFGAEYVQAFHPNTYVSPYFINQISKSTETSFNFSNALPDLDLGILGLGRFNAWQGLAHDLVAIPIEITAKK